MAKKIGRPTKYGPELANAICAQLAEGKSLRTVCLADEMPAASSVFEWLRTYKEFAEQYARAKEESADAMAEDILDIADDGTNDWMKVTIGKRKVDMPNKEVLQRSKLRVEARQWLMTKMKPKKYGDKLDVTSGGDKLPTPIYGGLSTTHKGHNSNQKDIQPS